jgi:CspA family cold shock protein
MKVLVTAVSASLFFIGLATQIYDRLLPENSWYLLVSMSIASVFASLITIRVNARLAGVRPSSRRPQASPRSSRSSRDQSQLKSSDAPREEGIVKWFNRTKGFGFIIRENGDEIFVHHRSVSAHGGQRANLSDGQRVTFTVVERSKGWQAEDVDPA